VKQIVLLFLFFFLPVSEAHALELTLRQCVDLAVENNSGLKAFEADVVASGEDVSISRTRFLPSLKLKGDYTLLDRSDVIRFQRGALASSPTIPPEDVSISAQNGHTYGASLLVEQPLFTGGSLTHSYKKSKIVSEEARQNFEREKTLLVFEVKRAFYRALKDQFQRRTMKKVLDSKKESLRTIRERNEEGYVPKEDLLAMETDVARSELDLYKIVNTGQFDLSRLKRTINYGGSEEVSLEEQPLNFSLAATLQEAEQTALSNNEDIKMSLNRIKAAGEDIEIAKGDYYPKASMRGSYTVQKETNIMRPNVWMFSAEFDWPIFEWNKTRSEVRKAEAKKLRLNYEHDELVKATLLKAEEAWREIKQGERDLEFQKMRIENAKDALTIAMNRYAEKVITFADLLEAETRVVTAYDDYMSKISDLDISRARLEAATFSAPDKWFIEKETYQIDLASLSQAVNELLLRKPGPPENSGDPGSHKAQEAPEQRPGSVDNASAAAVHAEKKVSPAGTLYAIQTGSFKNKKNADKLRQRLMGRTKGKRISILRQSDFYKVRISGFESREDAAKSAERLALKKYLIIKSRNGH
jgi:outer membrane protein